MAVNEAKATYGSVQNTLL